MRRLWKDATNDVAVIDHDGVEWLPIQEAATRLGVDYATLRQWIRRQKVEAHKIRGRVWVRIPDVMGAEKATRGAYLAQRGG